MNLADVANFGESGNTLSHDCSLVITVMNLLDCNWPSGPSVNNTLIKFHWYSYTLAVKDGPKLSYKIIYLILDIQGEVRNVKLITQLRLMYVRVENRQEMRIHRAVNIRRRMPQFSK